MVWIDFCTFFYGNLLLSLDYARDDTNIEELDGGMGLEVYYLKFEFQ